MYVCIGKGRARVRMRGLLGRGSAKVSLRSDGWGGEAGGGGGGERWRRGWWKAEDLRGE